MTDYNFWEESGLGPHIVAAADQLEAESSDMLDGVIVAHKQMDKLYPGAPMFAYAQGAYLILKDSDDSAKLNFAYLLATAVRRLIEMEGN